MPKLKEVGKKTLIVLGALTCVTFIAVSALIVNEYLHPQPEPGTPEFAKLIGEEEGWNEEDHIGDLKIS